MGKETSKLFGDQKEVATMCKAMEEMRKEERPEVAEIAELTVEEVKGLDKKVIA